MFDPEKLARENIRSLKPYTSARDEFSGTAEIYLDANENAFGSPVSGRLNRYPDPLQRALKEKIAPLKGIDSGRIFVGNGSDEAIDLLLRIFCEPGRDAAIVCPPTYGMYTVAAAINSVAVNEIPLNDEFQLNVPSILDAAEGAKLIFICSPNNPTGNSIDRTDILQVAERFAGIVVVDEAYIDFSHQASMIGDLGRLPNLVVLQTFSKAWGMAAARVGVAFGNEKIIELLARVKPPYNVSGLSQDAVAAAIVGGEPRVADWIEQVKQQRGIMRDSLLRLKQVEAVYPSDANFLLVKFSEADKIYKFLLSKRIVVRNRGTMSGCERCLRLTIGTPGENQILISALEKYENQAASASAEKTI